MIMKNPVIKLFICGYFSCVAVGWLILQSPACQTGSLPQIDAFFTAASAVSTTGLVSVDIGKTFSFFGQLVLLLLIQFGGIGYMIFSSFINLNIMGRTAELLKSKLASVVSLSNGVTVIDLVKRVVIYTVICEIIGLTALYFFFKTEGIDNSLWCAIFHSVSAFCTAGFSLFSSNLVGYKSHLGINATLSFLSLFGAFGFFLWMDFFTKITDQKIRAGFIRIMQAFVTSAIAIGVLLFFLTVIFPETISGFHKLIISFFQIISAITTSGFNTVDIRTLSLLPHLLLIIFMLLGVSLTGNGTDMRGTSFVSLAKLVANGFRKKTDSSWNQKILLRKTQIACSTFIKYVLVLLLFALPLNLIEKQPFLPLLFETTSALCTVGLSMEVTPELSAFGKILMALLMLGGRIGILIMGFAISSRAKSWERAKSQELIF